MALLGGDWVGRRPWGAPRLRVCGGEEGSMIQREVLSAGEVENEEGLRSPKP